MEEKVLNLKGKADFTSVAKTSSPFVMYSALTANMQVYIKDGDYFVESSCDRRGAIPEINKGIFVAAVACAPTEFDAHSLRKGFADIMMEKIINECYAYEGMIEQLKSDGKLPKDTMCDFETIFNGLVEDLWIKYQQNKY